MIEANDVFLIEELRRTGVSNRSILRILRNLSGMRIYIRKKKSEYEEIRTLYNQMIKQGVKRSDAVKRLSELYEKSEGRIRGIVSTQRNLFEI